MPVIVREKEVVAFAKRYSELEGRQFDEELRRGTVFCRLSNIVFCSQSRNNTNNGLRIPVAPKATNSDTQRANLNWSRLSKVHMRLGVPAELFPRGKIESGNSASIQTALVFYFFLYHLAKANDYTAEFSFDIPEALTNFLASFDSVRALVLCGSIPLSAVPQQLQGEISKDVQVFLSHGQGGTSSSSRASSQSQSRSGSQQPHPTENYNHPATDEQQHHQRPEEVRSQHQQQQQPQQPLTTRGASAGSGGFEPRPHEQQEPNLWRQSTAEFHSPPSAQRHPAYYERPTTMSSSPDPRTMSPPHQHQQHPQEPEHQPQQDQFKHPEVVQGPSPDGLMFHTSSPADEHAMDKIEDGSTTAHSSSSEEEDAEEGDDVAEVLIQENEQLRSQLHEVIGSYQGLEAEVRRLKDLDRANHRAQSSVDARLSTLRTDVTAKDEALMQQQRELQGVQQKLAAKEAQCHQLENSLERMSQENSDLHAKFHDVAAQLQHATAAQQYQTTSPSRQHNQSELSHVSGGNSAQKVLLAEQEAQIEALEMKLHKMSQAQPRTVEGAERMLFPSPTPHKPPVAAGSPAPHVPTASVQEATRSASASTRTQSSRRSPSQRVQIPTTDIFVRDPSTLPRHHQQHQQPHRLVSPQSDNAAAAGGGSLPKMIRLQDLDDSPTPVLAEKDQGGGSEAMGAGAGDLVQVNCHDLAAEMHQKLLELSVSRAMTTEPRLHGLVEGIRKSLWLLLSSTHVLESRILSAGEAMQQLQEDVDNEEDSKLRLQAEVDELKGQLVTKVSQLRHEGNKVDVRTDVLQGRVMDLESDVKRLNTEKQILQKKHQSNLESVAQEEERRMLDEKTRRRSIQQRHSAACDRDQLWRELCATLTQVNQVTLNIASTESDDVAVQLAQQRTELETKTSSLTRRIGESFQAEQRLSHNSSSATSSSPAGNGAEEFSADVSTALKQMMREAVAERDSLQSQCSELKQKSDTQHRELRSTVAMLDVERKSRKQLEGDLQVVLREKHEVAASKASLEVEWKRKVEDLLGQLKAVDSTKEEGRSVWSVPPPVPLPTAAMPSSSASSPMPKVNLFDSASKSSLHVMPVVGGGAGPSSSHSYYPAFSKGPSAAPTTHSSSSLGGYSTSPLRKSLLDPRSQVQLDFNF